MLETLALQLRLQQVCVFTRSDRATMRSILFIPVLLLVACSDGDIKSREVQFTELDATVNVAIDAGSQRVEASGWVQSENFALTIADNVFSDAQEDPDLLAGRIRLVDGDAFWLDWQGNSVSLFRRVREFIYQNAFDLPEVRDFIVRLAFVSVERASMQLPVQNVDIASFQLMQRGQVVGENSELTLSWNLDTGGFPAGQSIRSIDAVTHVVVCLDAAGQVLNIEGNLESRFQSALQSNSLSLPVSSIISTLVSQNIAFQSIDAQRCEFDIRLQVVSRAESVITDIDQQNTMRVNLTTSSAPQTVTVLSTTTLGSVR